jgi:photosystem II stability/assembly factor-like uncharacterized protein
MRSGAVRGHRVHRGHLLVKVVFVALTAPLVLTGCAKLAGPQTAPPKRPAVDIATGQPAPFGADELLDVSCPTPTRCFAVGAGTPDASVNPKAPIPAVIISTNSSGQSWSSDPFSFIGPSTLQAVSCPDALHCMAVGLTNGASLLGVIAVTDDGGVRWHQVFAPEGATDVVGVDCSIAEHCIAVASDGSSMWSAVTVDNGAEWTRGGDLPAGIAGVGNITCSSATTCVLAGYTPGTPGSGAGTIAQTSDGGTTWTSGTLPPGVGLLHSVSCGDPETCVAVGTESTTDSDVVKSSSVVLASHDGGMTWVAEQSAHAISDAFGVWCASDFVCVMVGTRWSGSTPLGGVSETANGGASWEEPAIRYIATGLTAVDCPLPTNCVAVGDGEVVAIALPGPASAASGRRL